MSDASQEYGQTLESTLDQSLAPDLPFRPPFPSGPLPKIALIGAGGITEYHLRAYQKLGLEVAAIVNPTLSKAEARRDEFFPEAQVFPDHRELLGREDISVFDITAHPEARIPIVEEALRSGKHVLSQKPFALDTTEGQRLCDLADELGRKLAVNQNGRWAPHFAYMQSAVRAGVIGDVGSIDFMIHWDHTWTAGTPFEEIHHLLLFDFGIHWFDMATALMGGRLPRSVFAQVASASYQEVKPPFLASVVADYGDAQVRIAFNALTAFGQRDQTVVAGSKGTLRAGGASINEASLTLFTDAGEAPVDLEGSWFESGFEGTMTELLCAIEEDRAPANSARENLKSLAFCFAAIRSADSGIPQTVVL